MIITKCGFVLDTSRLLCSDPCSFLLIQMNVKWPLYINEYIIWCHCKSRISSRPFVLWLDVHRWFCQFCLSAYILNTAKVMQDSKPCNVTVIHVTVRIDLPMVQIHHCLIKDNPCFYILTSSCLKHFYFSLRLNATTKFTEAQHVLRLIDGIAYWKMKL